MCHCKMCGPTVQLPSGYGPLVIFLLDAPARTPFLCHLVRVLHAGWWPDPQQIELFT